MVRAMRAHVLLPRWAAPLAALVLVAGCASGPAPPARDGATSPVPADPSRTPNAEPRLEPIRPGGPNKPYEVEGRSYTPETRDLPLREKGVASWYGKPFHGRRTASGEVYNMHAMTAAHKTMPLPSYARVRNPDNGSEIVVRINDRGPFVAGRVIDLSFAAAVKLGVKGLAPVEVERITYEDIRTGAWRQSAPAPVPAADTLLALADAAQPAAGDAALPSPLALLMQAPTPLPQASTVAAPVADGQATRALTAAARGWWVQLGAFRDRRGAEGFHQRVAGELEWLAPLMALFNEAPLYRLQAGPYASRDEAQLSAQRVREALRLVPLLIERR